MEEVLIKEKCERSIFKIILAKFRRRRLYDCVGGSGRYGSSGIGRYGGGGNGSGKEMKPIASKEITTAASHGAVNGAVSKKGIMNSPSCHVCMKLQWRTLKCLSAQLTSMALNQNTSNFRCNHLDIGAKMPSGYRFMSCCPFT